MLNKVLAEARRIAGNLGGSENSIDTALLAHARLLESIVEGALATGTAAQDSAPAVAHAIEAVANLGKARASVVACHASLADIRDKKGISPKASGCLVTKITDTAEPAGRTPLSAVA